MRALVWVALLACDGGKEPVAPKAPAPTPSPADSAIPAPPSAAIRTSFPRVAKADRIAIADAIAKQFPAAWKPSAEADYGGMPKQIVLELPEMPPDPVARALEIVGDHADLFGVIGPLHHEVDKDLIWIGAGDSWTGSMVAQYHGSRLTLSRHLWPIASVPVPVKAEAEHVVAPFYGRKGQYLSRCRGCADHKFVVDKSSFQFVSGMALICSTEAITVRPLIAIAPTYKPGSRIDGIETLPGYLDPETLAPVAVPPGGAIYFPGNGTFENGTAQFGPAHGFDYATCFE